MPDRVRDYAALLAVLAALTLPNLGSPSLWDDDEGVNAQAAREMRDAGTWIIPTFNYQLRTAKPVMLYWLQRASYNAFGVSEWSARLPSVVAGWLAVLLTYELARRMFGRGTGLLAGIILASVVQFGMLTHAATPDATLLLFTTLTYLAFWNGHTEGSRRWWVPTAVACGLAVLTKGPVGLLLPGLVILVYFAWNRELSRLLDRRLVLAVLAFLLVAGPWYGLVASETRGEWVKSFIGRENLQRFTSTMERHGGSVVYYFVALPVMFAPWSAFILAVLWYGVRGTGRPNPPTPVPSREGGAEVSSIPPPGEGFQFVRAHRFLVCWFGVYLVFFSAAATKLPNYIFPLYPALAILTARFLVTWRDGLIAVPGWVMAATVGAMGFVGVAISGGLLFADRMFPGLAVFALLGLVPLAGAAVMGRALRRDDRNSLVTAATVASVLLLGPLVAMPPLVVDRQKAPKELVQASGVDNPTRDIRLASLRWLPPSVVYYCGREVRELDTPEKAVAFLEVPTPGYLFVTEPMWKESLVGRVTVPYRIAARHRDFMEKCDVLVITNEITDVVSRRDMHQ